MLRISILAFLAVCGHVMSHTYHLGTCPVVEPMPGFDMNRVSFPYCFLCIKNSFVFFFICSTYGVKLAACLLI